MTLPLLATRSDTPVCQPDVSQVNCRPIRRTLWRHRQCPEPRPGAAPSSSFFQYGSEARERSPKDANCTRGVYERKKRRDARQVWGCEHGYTYIEARWSNHRSTRPRLAKIHSPPLIAAINHRTTVLLLPQANARHDHSPVSLFEPLCKPCYATKRNGQKE